jgi:Zn-dependent alcohol dehydrogenase
LLPIVPLSSRKPFSLTEIRRFSVFMQVTSRHGKPACHTSRASQAFACGTRFQLPAAVESPFDMTGVDALQQSYAGVQALRNIALFVKLIEKGPFDAKSLVGKTYAGTQMREALQAAADLSVITSVITFL